MKLKDYAKRSSSSLPQGDWQIFFINSEKSFTGESTPFDATEDIPQIEGDDTVIFNKNSNLAFYQKAIWRVNRERHDFKFALVDKPDNYAVDRGRFRVTRYRVSHCFISLSYVSNNGDTTQILQRYKPHEINLETEVTKYWESMPSKQNLFVHFDLSNGERLEEALWYVKKYKPLFVGNVPCFHPSQSQWQWWGQDWLKDFGPIPELSQALSSLR